MDRSDVITLLSEADVQDANGVWHNIGNYLTDEDGKIIRDEAGIPIQISGEHTVFCQVDSVTRSEFFEGGRNGLNPEFVFRMFAGDYRGERTLRYDNKIYGIYRTFMGRNDIIELYAERKGGTNK
jgi:hypothetical protein